MRLPRLVEHDRAERRRRRRRARRRRPRGRRTRGRPARRPHPGPGRARPAAGPGLRAGGRARRPARRSTGSIGHGRPVMASSSSAAPARGAGQRAHVVERRRELEDARRRARARTSASGRRCRSRRPGCGSSRPCRCPGRWSHTPAADERRRARRRAARRPAGVPRVERHAVGRVDAARGVLEQVGLAEEVGAGGARASPRPRHRRLAGGGTPTVEALRRHQARACPCCP